MTEVQYQVTVEVPHESLSTEVMALLTTMKSVMTITHQQMMDAVKHVRSKTIIFEQLKA